jgi:hypothetical protein
MQQIKILLAQTASNGDCLFVTTIAKQIKEIDYPGCHLTWLISSRFVQAIINNPYIDDILQIPLASTEPHQVNRDKIDEHILKAGGSKKFDKIFITDYTPANYKNWFGTTRSSLFRSYPHKLKIDPQPLMFLTETERENVAAFCAQNNITTKTFNILFECSPQAHQSLMTLEKAKQIAHDISANDTRIKFILTSNLTFKSDNAAIIDGSGISWRENAELVNYCDMLIGCSSGISWLCTSNWSKPVKTIQVINPDYSGGRISASMKMDFKFWGIDTSKLIELNNPSDSILKKCIILSITNFREAKKIYDTKNYNIFLNYRFTKEARIPTYEKLWFFLCYLFGGTFFKICYRAIKPNWFTPKR